MKLQWQKTCQQRKSRTRTDFRSQVTCQLNRQGHLRGVHNLKVNTSIRDVRSAVQVQVFRHQTNWGFELSVVTGIIALRIFIDCV